MARRKRDSDAEMHGESEKEGKYWGKGEYANMPGKVEMQEYPKGYKKKSGVLDDTIRDIDRVEDYAGSRASKYLSNQK